MEPRKRIRPDGGQNAGGLGAVRRDPLRKKDPYNHLRSIHNCIAFYDHSRPWITHCSLQRQDLYRHVEYTEDYRVRYGKPVVWDEIAYEGNIDMGWGNISGQELTRRFWEASLRGGYAGARRDVSRPRRRHPLVEPWRPAARR